MHGQRTAHGQRSRRCPRDGPRRGSPLSARWVPAEVRKAATLTVATDPTSEPITYLDGTNYVELDVDLGNAIADRLGLKLNWTTVSFGDVIDQVAAHQVDLSMTAMFDKADRQEKIDFLDYFYAGASIVVPKGTGDINGLGGLCGRRVAVQLDTVYVDMAALQQERCPASAPLTVVTVPGNPIGELAAKRVNTVINDYPIAVADVAKTPDVEISGRQIEPLPYGIGFARDNQQLMLAFQEAFYLLVQDGTYDKVLEKWKLTEGPCGPVSSTAACDGPQGNPAAQWMCEPPLTS